MATIVLSAAGAALGGSIGGSVLGLSSVVAGRFVGATLGRVVDQRLMGQGSDVVEQGKVDRFRLTGAGEGAPIAQVFGRMRVGGHVIWASAFEERVARSGGGKGSPSRPKTETYSYSVSLAVALCEGEIAGVLRVWADGSEVAPEDLNMRVYTGAQDQLPDPKIEAVEGSGTAPAYRGTAYVVMEDLPLDQFGNRVPQFSFEVLRPEEGRGPDRDPVHNVQGVALMPGTGEYALATTPVTAKYGPGQTKSLNINSPSGQIDMETAMAALRVEAPQCQAVSLIVSWFGDDLRAAECRLRPKVEQTAHDGVQMPWRVSGLNRAAAQTVPEEDGRVVYGGTPADTAVVEAIGHIQGQGRSVMFYPFILMEQLDGNARTDPWTGAGDQPRLPWRGRITGSVAPNRPGSPDQTALAETEVAAFVGTVTAADFQIGDGTVTYTGPDEWSYRRFILHYAALCSAAGGVESFCIGSEMRSLTQLRGDSDRFPFVTELRAIAAECRLLLGGDTKIGYAADWSEYSGYQPDDGSGDRYFHLDALWADDNIDFIGIDNYMPLSDWRDGPDHADAEWGAVYNPEYLKANVAGGEGYHWFYHSQQAREAQIRTPITDGDHDEPWVWRVKDIRNWWQNPHHERVGGTRLSTPTAWVPESKPIWFTEMGCAAVDKGTNQPNKFLDPKSSESALPYFSDGRRDDLIQMQYLRAMYGYWLDPAHNPVSAEYEGPMVDMSRAFVWAWDARPYPFFPGNRDLWSDGENYSRGHWISGRLAGRSLAGLVKEVCARAGVAAVDTSRLYGYVRGYAVSEVDAARGILQPLLLAHGVDAVERDGVLSFRMRDQADSVDIDLSHLVENDEIDGRLEMSRAGEAELAGRLRLRFIETDGNYDIAAEETVLPDEGTHAVSTSDLPLSMTRGEGRQILERWLAESRVARDTARFSLPPSRMDLGAGDIVRLPTDAGGARFRIDRVEQGPYQVIEAVRMEPGVYRASEIDEAEPLLSPFVAPVPVDAVFMDLPLLRGDEVPHAPHLAVTAVPWPGAVAAFSALNDADYALNTVVSARATIGLTETPLMRARVGLLDRASALQVRLASGAMESVELAALLSGANVAAIGDGSSDAWEVIQFRGAELIDDQTFVLRDLLRGQFGSDGQMPEFWPVGSQFVLLDGAPQQLSLPEAARGSVRNYRVGPARRPVDDPSYTGYQLAFDGIGLRPYAPVHLRTGRTNGGDLRATWIRRTRIAGDSWAGIDVPVGEEREEYLVRVVQNGAVRREVLVPTSEWVYPAAQEALDTGGRSYDLMVAQVSAQVGAGYAAQISVIG